MTKKEMTVGKTTYKYTIEDFKNYLICKAFYSLEKKKCADELANAALVELNNFEKECKNGK